MRVACSILIASCTMVLTGCSGVSGINSTPASSASVPGPAIAGRAHGGQQPIVGAHVYLYAANTTGYGSASTSLLASGTGRSQDGHGNYYVTTDANGDFSITGAYSCPSAYSQVYLYSLGGNPGAGANSAIALVAALGTCNSLSSSTYAVINEVSTIASAYALAGYAVDPLHVSSSGSTQATLGLANAFAATTNLESLSTGLALSVTPAGNGTPPRMEIDSLANILATCVNSTGPSSAQCSSLFGYAMNGASTPADTATAAFNIAHNPGVNVANLYGLQTGSGPFQPVLSAVPNDFTVAITYTGCGLDGSGFAPEGIAVDGSGNVWITNYASSSVSKFSALGAALSGAGGLTAAGLDKPTSVAIDIYGNAWIANYNGNSLSEFNSSGTKISGPPGFTGSGLNQPYGICLDNLGHTWIANLGGNNLSEFGSTGTALSGASGFATGSLIGPAGIAADASGNIWSTNYLAPTSSITETNSSGGQYGGASGFTGGGLNSPYGIAVDASGNVWVTNQASGGSLSKFTSAGSAISGSSGFTGGGIDTPYGISVDGANNIWVANLGNDSISEFNASGTAISGTNGFMGTNGTATDVLFEPYGIAIDASGNAWVASDKNNSGSVWLTEFVGVAAPVVTPIAAGVEYNELGAKP